MNQRENAQILKWLQRKSPETSFQNEHFDCTFAKSWPITNSAIDQNQFISTNLFKWERGQFASSYGMHLTQENHKCGCECSVVLTVDHFRWVFDSRRVRVVHIFGVLYSCQPLSCGQFRCPPIGPFLNASLSIYVHRCCDELMRIVYIRIFQYCMMPIPRLAIALWLICSFCCCRSIKTRPGHTNWWRTHETKRENKTGKLVYGLYQ